MSANSLTKKIFLIKPGHNNWPLTIGLPTWVFTGFLLSQLLVAGVLLVIDAIGVNVPASDDAVFNTVIAAGVYVLTLGIVIGGPWLVRRKQTSKVDLGLSRLPSWMDILLSPAGFIIYLLFSALLVWGVASVVPGFNTNQVQEIGFQNLSQQYQYLLAFLTLIVIAPIAEEIVFRGYLYGKLRKHVPLWIAMLITSVLFGAVHGQWNVGLDTFALSIVMCSLREVTGSIWAGVLLHMTKNSIAFYFLFINPSLFNTLGG